MHGYLATRFHKLPLFLTKEMTLNHVLGAAVEQGLQVCRAGVLAASTLVMMYEESICVGVDFSAANIRSAQFRWGAGSASRINFVEAE